MHIPINIAKRYDYEMNVKDIRYQNLINLLKGYKSKKEFAEKCDLSPGHVSQLANRTRETGDKVAQKIELALSLQKGWMDRDHQNLPVKDAIPVTYKVPILDYVQAGSFTSIDYNGIEPIGWDTVTEDLKDTFALIIRGDSMDPLLKEGMTVYIRQQPTAEIGDIIVAQINGNTEATIKRYKKDAGTIYLVPENKEYDTIKITIESQDFKIIGKAVSARFNL